MKNMSNLQGEGVIPNPQKNTGKQEDSGSQNTAKPPPCGRYAERRRAVYRGVPMNELPPACGVPLGKKCKQGEHRDWEEEEREKTMGVLRNGRNTRDVEMSFSAAAFGDQMIYNIKEARSVLNKHLMTLPEGTSIVFPTTDRILVEILLSYGRFNDNLSLKR